MNDKIKGTLLGILASFGGIALFILFYYIGFIAGIAGALMGVLFYIVYKKINPRDTSKYPFIAATIVILVEVFVSLLIIVAMYSNGQVSIIDVLRDPEIKGPFILDLVLGYVLGFLVFGGFIFQERRKGKILPGSVQNIQPRESIDVEVSETSDSENKKD